MNAVVIPSIISGTVAAPPSKSYTHRAIIIASLARGKSEIRNILWSDDTERTVTACKKLGAKITSDNHKSSLNIQGVNGLVNPAFKKTVINCENSGTTARLILSMAALSKQPIIIEGSSRLNKRPMLPLICALTKQGAVITPLNKPDYLPVQVKGDALTGGEINISGELSSQFISSLLIVSPYAKREVIVRIINSRSEPYIDMTIDVMKVFGANVKKDTDKIQVSVNNRYNGTEYYIEGDYSSASYFLAAAAITNSEITVNDLQPLSVQGDKYFLTLLEKMGCQVKKSKTGFTLKGNSLHAIKVDLSNYPDIVPTLCVVAACAKGKTIIKNVGHLRLKESDRIAAVKKELTKMGIKISTTKDSIKILGGKLHGTSIDTYHDHRIAMSFAVAGLAADGKTIITNKEVVEKSYKTFFEDFQKIGAKISYL